MMLKQLELKDIGKHLMKELFRQENKKQKKMYKIVKEKMVNGI